MTKQVENLPILFGILAVFFLALFLRFWQIDSLVPVLNRDEAALAFSAYMLKEAGVDEWGREWSLTQESFGDYKLVGYPTLLVALFSVFPYQDWVVRLPSAMAGALLIIPTYFWALWLSKSKRWSLLAAFLIAISPVFGHFSRFAYEANVALLLITSSLLVLFNRFSNHYVQLVATLVGVGFFAASITLYNTPFLYLPFITVLYVLSKGIFNHKQWLLGTFLLFIVGTMFFIAFQPLLSQKSGISILTDETLLIEGYPKYIVSLPEVVRPLLDSQYIYFATLFTTRLLQAFSPSFLVLSGGQHPWHSLAGYAHISWGVYLFSISWILTYLLQSLKLVSVLKKQALPLLVDGKLFSAKVILILLLIISLLPASVTVDAPHATRSLLFFFGLTLASVLMMQLLYNWIRSRSLFVSQLVFTIIILIITIEHLLYWSHYFSSYGIQQQSLYYPGFADTISQVAKSYPDQPVAIVDPTNGYQYVSLAWYLLPDPTYYLQTQIRQLPDAIGFHYGERVGNYHFIADAEDRDQSEEILIRWDDDQQRWTIETF